MQLPDDLLFDTQAAADCRIVTGTDVPRCLPATETVVVPYFSDDQCQTSIELALVGIATCDVRAPFAIRSTESGMVVHAVGPRYDLTIYEITTGDRCVPFLPAEGFEAHTVAAAIPIETFPAATLVIDP